MSDDTDNLLDIRDNKYAIKIIVKYLTNKMLDVDDPSTNEQLMYLRKENDLEDLEREEWRKTW